MAEHTLLHVRCDAPVGALQLHLDLTLTAPWTVIFGPSGSGKSSLLRLVSGLWRPDGSSVAVDGSNLSHLPAHLRRIGLVAQQPALFPHMSVRDNVRFACGGAELGLETEALLREHQIAHLVDTRPATLSGGERQRVALARALIRRPRLLLLDEVFTGLEMPLRDRMIELLRRRLPVTSEGEAMAIVSVTHDIAEAFACGDEVIRIREGRVVARGAPAEVLAEEREALMAQLRGA